MNTFIDAIKATVDQVVTVEIETGSNEENLEGTLEILTDIVEKLESAAARQSALQRLYDELVPHLSCADFLQECPQYGPYASDLRFSATVRGEAISEVLTALIGEDAPGDPQEALMKFRAAWGAIAAMARDAETVRDQLISLFIDTQPVDHGALTFKAETFVHRSHLFSGHFKDLGKPFLATSDHRAVLNALTVRSKDGDTAPGH